MAEQAQVDILIKIREELGGLRRAQTEMRQLREETTSLGGMFRAGGVFGLGLLTAQGIVQATMGSIVGSFRQAAEANSKLVNEIEKNATAFGLSAESYQTFSTVLRENGQDVGALGANFRILNQTLGDALNGNATAIESFSRIGLSVNQLRGLEPDALLERIAIALSRISDPAQRAASAQDVLGRSAAGLRPLLEALATKGVGGLQAEVGKTNGLLSGEYVRALDEAGDRSEAAGSRLAKSLAPAQLAIRNLSAAFKEFLADALTSDSEGRQPAPANRKPSASNPGNARFTELDRENATNPRSAETFLAVRKEIAAIESDISQASRRTKEIDKQIELLGAYRDLERQIFADAVRSGDARSEQTKAANTAADPEAIKREKEAITRLRELRAEREKIDTQALSDQEKLAEIERQRVSLSEQLAIFANGSGSAQTAVRAQEISNRIASLRIDEKSIQDRIDAANKTANDKALAEASKSASNQRAAEDAAIGREKARIEREIQAVENQTLLTQSEKWAKILPLMLQENRLADERIAKLKEQLALEKDPAAVQQIQRRLDALDSGKQDPVAPQTRFEKSKQSFREATDSDSPDRLSAGEGVAAGAADFVSNLGSVGEQVSDALQSSIGSTVSSISDGIYGWITGTEDFGDVIANLGDTVFRTMLDTIVQMGVQWLFTQLLIMTGMRTIEATGDAYRTARVPKENAAEAATLPAKTAGAAAAGISSYGVALAFGALAIALIFALSGGFKDGGYTGDGDANSVAGPAHRGEYYFNAQDVKRIGIPRIEALRFGRADTSAAASSARAFTPESAGSAGSTASNSNPPATYFFNEEADARRAMLNSGDFDAAVVRVMGNNRDRIG